MISSYTKYGAIKLILLYLSRSLLYFERKNADLLKKYFIPSLFLNLSTCLLQLNSLSLFIVGLLYYY